MKKITFHYQNKPYTASYSMTIITLPEFRDIIVFTVNISDQELDGEVEPLFSILYPCFGPDRKPAFSMAVPGPFSSDSIIKYSIADELMKAEPIPIHIN